MHVIITYRRECINTVLLNCISKVNKMQCKAACMLSYAYIPISTVKCSWTHAYVDTRHDISKESVMQQEY